MARKKKHEEHENHERWLVSYADFITLLFAFFVVMYSLSAVNEGKFRVMAEALKAAFQSKPMSPDPIQFNSFVKPEILGTPELRNLPGVTDGDPQAIALPKTPFPGRRTGGQAESGQARAMREIADKVNRAMQPLIEKGLIAVKGSRYWLEVEIKSSVLFPSGSAQVQPDAVPVLKRLAGILQEYPNRVQVEGFTDNVPIRTAAFPSNWELSTARATSVVHLFSGVGLSPGRLAAVGYGEHRPSAPNDTEAGRSKNRKVVLVILADDEDAARLHELTAGQGAPVETAVRTQEPAVPATEAPKSPIVLTPPMEPLEQLLPELKREATAILPSTAKPIGVDGTAMSGAVAGTAVGDSRGGEGRAAPGAAAEKPSIVITKPQRMDAPVAVPMDANSRPSVPDKTIVPPAARMPAGGPLASDKPLPLDRVISLPALPKPGG
ncbi:MAG: flagellar motor protein MotD [Gammaproteobacteria bacterium]|nr:MAG: flagellar motor protein MotD [Gammaproteobacteria bacterium]